MAEDPTQKQGRIQVQMDEEVMQGMYINLALVHHSETEFTLDVMYLPPHQSKAKMRARIISSPKHTKRLMLVLQENLSRYEQRYGTIDLSGPNPADKLLH